MSMTIGKYNPSMTTVKARLPLQKEWLLPLVPTNGQGYADYGTT